MTPDTASAAPAVDVLSGADAPSIDLGSLSEAQLDSWRLTGEVPAATLPVSTTEGSTPPAPAAQAASTDASEPPASEAGTPARPNAETRKAALKAEIETLLQERARLRGELDGIRSGTERRAPDAPPAASSPAPRQTAPVAGFPTLDEFYAQPENAGKTYEDYTRALIVHTLEGERQQALAQQQIAAKVQGFSSQIEKVVAEDPAFLESLAPAVRDLVPETMLTPGAPVYAGNVVAQVVMDSDAAPLLLKHLSDHPAVLGSILSLPSRDAVVRQLGRLEGELTAAVRSPSPAPVMSVVSQAPPPATTLGSRPAGPADSLEAALARGDVESYMREANARDVAKRKAGG
jgi:hypothetical protein